MLLPFTLVVGLFAATFCSAIELEQLEAYLYCTSQIMVYSDTDTSGYLVYEQQQFLSQTLGIYDFASNRISLTHSVNETLSTLEEWGLYPRSDQNYTSMSPANRGDGNPQKWTLDYGNEEYLRRWRQAGEDDNRVSIVNDLHETSASAASTDAASTGGPVVRARGRYLCCELYNCVDTHYCFNYSGELDCECKKSGGDGLGDCEKKNYIYEAHVGGFVDWFC